jgi:hypothetical protein
MIYNQLRIETLHADSDLSFLNHYQYEEYYYQVLSPDPNTRLAFTKHKIERRIRKHKNGNTLYCVKDDEKVYLMFGVDRNELHSSVFNQHIIEIGPLYLLDHSKYDGIVEILRTFLAKYELGDPTYYKCKVDNSDFITIKLLQECGFSYVTSALKMLYNPQKDEEVFDAYYTKKYSAYHDELEVQVIQYSDYKESIDILISQHKQSVHYYMYGNIFPQSEIQTLFMQWFNQYAHSVHTTILGLMNTSDKTLLGFTSFCGPINIGNTPVYSRDLTIIHKEYQGKSLALLLYKKMNEITNACIEGNPLSDNYRNVQLNQHCGYSIVQSRSYMIRFRNGEK